MRWNQLLLSSLALVLIAGCDEPKRDVNTADRPTEIDRPAQLDAESLERRIEKFTFRVRNLTCTGVALGSGFAVFGDTIITNRHVADGAERIELNTWTGGSMAAVVEGVAFRDDLAAMKVSRPLPATADLASSTPEIGDELRTAGFPLGDAYQLSTGEFTGMGIGPYGGRRLTLDDALVEHGNSGGPVMNTDGEVVGVLTEGDEEGSTRYAIPVDRVSALLNEPLREPTTC